LAHFPGTKNFFEKQQVVAFRFSEDFCINLRNASTNRKRGISLSCFKRDFSNSKVFSVKRIRITEFSRALKGELKKNE
jgi:hypothetical protein